MAERGSVAAATTPEGASTLTNQQTTVPHKSNGHTSLSNGVKVEPFSDNNKEENMGGDEQTTKSHMQDIPLDFSVKRKSVESISESLTDESQVSSVSPPASHDSQEPFPEPRSNESVSNGSFRSLDQIGEPRTLSGMSPNSLSLGYLSRMSPGLLPNGHLPPLPPFMDQRLLQGSKHTRPFKAYPKEALSMPLGYLGAAGFPAPPLDDPSLQGMNLSPDELMNIYKQQIQVLRERDKQLLALAKQHSPVETTSPHRNGISSSSSNNSSSNTTTTHNNNGTTTSPSMPTAVSSPSMFTPPACRPGPMVSSTSALTSAGRKRPRSLPDEQKDEAYWERRRKNNDAAKRSRDARRAKEDEIAIRAALLEQENLKLRVEVAALKTETARLRCMLYNS